MLDGLTNLDYILLVFLLINGIRGISRGGVGKLCDFAAWIGAILGAIWLYPIFYGTALTYLGDGLNAQIVTVIGLLIILMIVLSLVSYWVSHQVRQNIHIPFDRTFGFIWGVFHGIVIIMAAFVGIKIFLHVTAAPEWLGSARSYSLMLRLDGIIEHFIPNNFR